MGVVLVGVFQSSTRRLGNMVAGSAKAALADTPHAFTLSLPMTVEGDADWSVPIESVACANVAWCTVAGEPLRIGLWVSHQG